ncbi:hypothetical protein [Halorarius litoreus]|uniref:hypothetical protein n=1 Tax=Halorarius litoreus TaxID=2962676 RepID=UPI0020CD28A4|nr:hypothetical protein [Halorarius litoreus]
MADLRRWTFATFHTGLLVLLAVWLIHLSDALRDLLGGLDTLVGLALYAVLWGIVWLATGRAFDAAPPTESSTRRLLQRGAVYGALTGVGFLLVVLVGGFVAALLLGGQVLSVLIFAFIGAVVAAIIGGVIGVGFALLDRSLLRLGARLTPGEQ